MRRRLLQSSSAFHSERGRDFYFLRYQTETLGPIGTNIRLITKIVRLQCEEVKIVKLTAREIRARAMIQTFQRLDVDTIPTLLLAYPSFPSLV